MPIKKSELYSSIWKSCDEMRGGMDASQYKDYVLVLLFMKYVSDKAASQKGYLLDVPKGGSFADMVALKGKADIGDKINKIIARLADKNPTLKGAIDVADFNDEDKLGKGDGNEKTSDFDDMSLIQLIVARGSSAIDALPPGIKGNHDAVAETIENNVRRLIIDEHPINPKYYDRMSQLLEALIKQRREEALDYQEYLRRIVEITKHAAHPETGGAYPRAVNTPGRRALFDNLGKNESLALAIDGAIHASRQDDWRNNPFKIKMVANAVRAAMESGGMAPDDEMMDSVMALVKRQDEY